MKYIFTLVLLILATFNSRACVCTMYPVETYLGKVDLVFTGKVIEILDKPEQGQSLNVIQTKGYTVKVLVLTRIKTGAIKADTLEFTSDFTDCDPLYRLGESYLFFADKSDDKRYKMTHCTYWDLLKESGKNIKKLKRAVRLGKIQPKQH